MTEIKFNKIVYTKLSDGTIGVGTGVEKLENVGNGAIEGVEVTGEITICKYIENTRVTVIRAYAFRECTKITAVNIKACITRIDHGAFYHCKSLENIVLPKTLKTIDNYAFSMYSDRSLPFLVIFEKGINLQEIGISAFEHQFVSTTIVLPMKTAPLTLGIVFNDPHCDINIYTYTKGLDISGITTKQLSQSPDYAIITCKHRFSSSAFLVYQIIFTLC